MSSELIRYTPMEQVQLGAEVWPLANKLASTEFVGKGMRGKPEAVMACMLFGAEIGLPLMESLQEIHVIDGRPAMSAKLMRKLVQRAGHTIYIEESTNTRCTVVGVRKGTDREQKFTRTLDDARAAGLAGKDNWKKYPADMLLARASAALCRAVFADALGVTYSIEELEDGDSPALFGDVDDSGAPVVQAPRRRKAAQAATRGAQGVADSGMHPETEVARRVPEPPLPGEDDDIIDADVVEVDQDPPSAKGDDAGPVEAPSPPPAGVEGPYLPDYVEDDPLVIDPGDLEDHQRAHGSGSLPGPAMIAIEAAKHLPEGGTREQKLALCSEVVGRDVASSKDLTPDEVGLVLRALAELGEGEMWEFPTVLATGEDVGGPAPVAEVPRAPSGPEPEEWDGDAWRAFIKKRGLKPTGVMPKVHEFAARAGVRVATLDEIAGHGIADDLVAWCEDEALG